MGRFNNETLEVQELRIDMIVSILIHGLRKGPFTSALARDPSSDVEQLMALAQKYIDEEELNAMKDSSEESASMSGDRMMAEKGVVASKNKKNKRSRNTSPNTITILHWPCRERSGEVRRSRSRSRDRNPCPSKTDRVPTGGSNAPTKGVLYTIAGGSSVGDSGRTRKRCARTVGSSREREFVLKVEDEEAISFDSSDRLDIANFMNDPMVVKLDIVNFAVHKVLIDSRSSTDIIFKSVVDKMGLENARLEPVKTPLVGIGGSEVSSLGTIELPVSMGEEPKRKTLMVKFLVVDTPFTYNVILGRLGLNSFRAVISTYHMKMKFPMEYEIGEVLCDQKEARKCYNLSLKGELGLKK
ncbi:uncharacterized protein LOC110013115 [Sesamum indicum]|uniref:Uncharacterized protein LOC110013115 n=1 Tax=Sesamum indicum TaxID=4182 RepID=A0A8M8VEC1_SESIN|nr:uncharacterized protein LOC110013115 [Sesamum indicum]